MGEEVLYDSENITVTTSRFIVDNQTYALSGITSVSMWELPPSYKGAIFATIFGLIIAFLGYESSSDTTLFIGAIVLFYGIYLFFKLKTKYTVRIQTASGEINAVWSYDRELIERIVNALNEAIIQRDAMFVKGQNHQND